MGVSRLLEVVQANRLAGGDGDTGWELIDRGLWDNPHFDPETASTGELFLPLGPWPEGTFTLVSSESTDYYI
jgi:hypothetical protein